MRVCIPGEPTTIGGPESFKRKLAQGLDEIGVEVTFDIDSHPYDVVLVVALTRNLKWLYACKRKGIPIVHRLDGFHRYGRHFSIVSRNRWHETILNQYMRIVRNHFADAVVYQSEFVKQWWRRASGDPHVPFCIIPNGVDTDLFSPEGEQMPRREGISLVSCESSFGVHEIVFRTPIDTWKKLNARYCTTSLCMLGPVPEHFRQLVPPDSGIEFRTVANSELPYYYRGATAFIAAELNPGCPNTVIEALACGTPVVSFATGAVPELVPEYAGICVNYGGNPWKFDEPNMDGLVDAVEKVAANQESYSNGARQVAIEKLSLKDMVARYIEVFESALEASGGRRETSTLLKI